MPYVGDVERALPRKVGPYDEGPFLRVKALGAGQGRDRLRECNENARTYHGQSRTQHTPPSAAETRLVPILKFRPDRAVRVPRVEQLDGTGRKEARLTIISDFTAEPDEICPAAVVTPGRSDKMLFSSGR